MRAVVGGAARLNEAFDWGATATARTSLSIVDIQPRTFAFSITATGRATDDHSDRREQTADDWQSQSTSRALGVEFRAPERFRCVDVAETSDDPLLEQSNLDRNAPSLKCLEKRRGRQRRIGRLGSEIERKLRFSRMNIDRGERT